MRLLLLFFILAAIPLNAQIRAELTSRGFTPVEVTRPNRTTEKLIEVSRAWVPYYNREEADVYDVSENSLKIDAVRHDAFFYRNRGEIFTHSIRYTLEVVFEPEIIRMRFIVKDIFADNNTNVISGLTVTDFFAPDGRLKEDYEEVRPSLEKTAANIMRSYAAFLTR